MALFANQRTVQVNRSTLNKRNPFLLVNTDTIFEAARELDGTSFKVYLYLLSNKDGYIFDFSPQHIANVLGISRDSARLAFEKLERKNFLVSAEYGKYQFYEYQNPEQAIIAAKKRKENQERVRNYYRL